MFTSEYHEISISFNQQESEILSAACDILVTLNQQMTDDGLTLMKIDDNEIDFPLFDQATFILRELSICAEKSNEIVLTSD